MESKVDSKLRSGRLSLVATNGSKKKVEETVAQVSTITPKKDAFLKPKSRSEVKSRPIATPKSYNALRGMKASPRLANFWKKNVDALAAAVVSQNANPNDTAGKATEK